ncbi:MAG: GNAT family N-acetyltransferase, partial [Victivallales bacterium]|nr:GNAT family N-acetyltransferase [Victivallales bacterium]
RIKADMAAEILDIRHDAVHYGKAREFYPREALQRWSPPPHAPMIQMWSQLWSQSGALGVLARDLNGYGIGFGILDIGQDKISAIYVRAEWTGKGAGSSIIRYLEKIALVRGAKMLMLDASLNSVNFYLRHWYLVNGIDFLTLPSGEKLPCAKMSKLLQGAQNASFGNFV